MKKILAMLLTLAMILSVASAALADEPREIHIGTWWEITYDSDNDTWEVEGRDGTDIDIMQFEHVAEVENEYNVKYYFDNLTFSGVKDSINNSILAGEPDCDVYMVELGWGIPAAMNGLATDLRDVLDPSDPIFTHEDPVMDYVTLPGGQAYLLKEVTAQSQVEATYPLAFNLQMIEAANLEDPRELVDRGEWTWDKFTEYCQILTQDTDGDGVTDVYGYGGWIGDFFPYFYMSNGTNLAATEKENLSSPEMGETLKFIQDLYLNGWAYPIPEENGWDVCRYLYRDKKVAFATVAAWILDTNKDYGEEAPLDFDMVFIDYPIGPSGNAETNSTKLAQGNYYMIPAGVEDPKLVYDVLRTYHNWFHDDVELRDDPEALAWWYSSTSNKLDLQEANFELMKKMGSKTMVDFVTLVLADYTDDNVQGALLNLTWGNLTPAQMQEQYKQRVQDILDGVFK